MNDYFWDSQLEYLLETREKLWNKDYFKFLVKDVWNLNHAIDILDFGCGYGYLGLELLPLLPVESTYTGIDIGENLLRKAREIFINCPNKTEFINVDLNEYMPQQKYDVAICQAVLRHIPKAKTILQKMVDSVKPGGIVITIEVNRRIEDSGLYIHDLGLDLMERTNFYQRLWVYEQNSGEREYDFGSKVPIYMKELGLRDVDVRLNDCVEFITPLDNQEEYEKQITRFLNNSNFNRDFDKDFLTKLGLSDEEIDIFNRSNRKIREHLAKEKVSVVNARGLVISYGKK